MRIGINVGPSLFKGGSRGIPPEIAKKLDTSRSPAEWLVELLALAAIITHIVLLYNQYGSLPQIIPTHFGISGQADGFSGKKTLIFILGMNIVMYIMMTALANFPKLYNFAVAITAQNAQRQFFIARGMLLGLKVLVVWMFCYVSYQIMQVATGLATGMGWPLWLLLGLLMVVIGAGLILSYKLR